VDEGYSYSFYAPLKLIFQSLFDFCGMSAGLYRKFVLMSEYMSCGVKLDRLINPDDRQVEIGVADLR